MTVKKCEFKDGVCVHCGDDHIDTDCIGWIDTPPNPEIARLETELLAATIRIDNDARRLAEMAAQIDIQAGGIEVVQAANVRMAAERDLLVRLITATHKAKGRYHTQIAMCDLYDAVGLPNVRPVSGEAK